MGKKSKRKDAGNRKQALEDRRQRQLDNLDEEEEEEPPVRDEDFIDEGDRVKCYVNDERGWIKGVVRKKEVRLVRRDDGDGDGDERERRLAGLQVVWKVFVDYADVDKTSSDAIDLKNGHFWEQLTVLKGGPIKIVQIPHDS